MSTIAKQIPSPKPVRKSSWFRRLMRDQRGEVVILDLCLVVGFGCAVCWALEEPVRAAFEERAKANETLTNASWEASENLSLK